MSPSPDALDDELRKTTPRQQLHPIPQRPPRQSTRNARLADASIQAMRSTHALAQGSLAAQHLERLAFDQLLKTCRLLREYLLAWIESAEQRVEEPVKLPMELAAEQAASRQTKQARLGQAEDSREVEGP